ncbi:MAG: glyceraldehyde-3-phosphate dehydrogenase [Flavobacteriales bacterium]
MSNATINEHRSTYERELNEWVDKEKTAISLIASVGTLLYERDVDLVIFRNSLVDKSISEMLSLHQYAVDFVEKPISIYDTAAIAKEMESLPLAPSKIDVGRLAAEWIEEKEAYANVNAFLTDKLYEHFSDGQEQIEPKDVILYGFGRIGRLCARELIQQAGPGHQLRLKAIVTRSNSKKELVKRGALLRNDSVHGPFPGTVQEDTEDNVLIINGQRVQMIEADDPASVDYTQYGISNALVIDNSGAFRDRKGLGKHLEADGVSKALLTAPGKEDIPNVTFGVNHQEFDIEKEDLFSCASCTTNAIVPPLRVVRDELGIEEGHIETVHAYTNDQNLLDNMHKKNRRGRSAAINMVITETGAAKAVVKTFPDLEGKLTANAVRVPTADGSLAILNLRIGRATSRDELNEIFRNACLHGDLVEQIRYSIDDEMVSTDVIGITEPAVFDAPGTIVSEDGKNVVLYVWYDNEYGYTRQVMRMAKHIAQVRRRTYY